MTDPSRDIRFCSTSDGIQLAYATSGEGYPLVKAATWLTHLDFDWRSPVWRPWLEALSEQHQLIHYDERGCGLSDWDVERFTLEAWVEDLEAVVEATGLEKFALLGMSQGGPIAIAYAIKHPEKVSQLILYGSYARGKQKRNTSAKSKTEMNLMLEMIRVGWGKDNPAFRQAFTSLFVPEGSKEQMDWFNELQRISTTPENAARIVQGFNEIDVQALAKQISVPTLVLHSKEDARVPFKEGRLLAGLIPNARFVPLESKNHVLLSSEPAWRTFLKEVHAFMGVEYKAISKETNVAQIVEPVKGLTQREQDVLSLILEGLNNKAIAKKLFLSPKTVRNYVSLLYNKFNVHSRSELILNRQRSDDF